MMILYFRNYMILHNYRSNKLLWFSITLESQKPRLFFAEPKFGDSYNTPNKIAKDHQIKRQAAHWTCFLMYAILFYLIIICILTFNISYKFGHHTKSGYKV